MNLRLRLIAAFFLLSVVPLAALTWYGYTSNARAMRDAARHEAELLAGELTQRMQVVTSQLSDRVEYLLDLADAAAAVDHAVETSQAQVSAAEVNSRAAVTSAKSATETLGSIAMLLNNVELRDGFRGRGGRGGGFRGGPGGPGAPGAPGGPPPDGRGGGGRGRGGLGQPSRAAGSGANAATGSGAGGPLIGRPTGAPPTSPDGLLPPPPSAAPVPPAAPAPGVAPTTAAAPGAPPARGGDPADRISIDLMPIRTEILRQYASQEEFSKLTPTEQERIRGEVNQRMLGIQMGIRMGTAEAQRRIEEAQRAAETKANEAATAVRPTPSAAGSSSAPKVAEAAASPLKRKATLSGSRLDVSMERDGEVVHRANAEVDLPNLLKTVFSTTRRDRGEVPFAVSKEGHLYTQTDSDMDVVQDLGAGVTKADVPTGTTMVRDWIVVTTTDPTGSGLKFGIARPVGDSLRDLRRTSARNAAFGLAFIGLALIGIVPLSGRLTKNLFTLGEGVNRIAEGDYRARVAVASNDEIGRLANAFNHMAEEVERHQRAAVGQERLRRELELGRQIQHDMLPQAPLRLGLTEVKGISVPAREVGGDFFNYFQVSSGEVALLVGDVSGKGVGAALLMANIQASLRTRLALGQDLAAIAREIDVEIEANTPGSVYATLFLAMLNLETHELRYVNAGHHPQYVLRLGRGLERMPSTGLPVGLLSGQGYIERRVPLAAGDLLFFYTDGCVEAENEAGDMFGSEQLEELLTSSATRASDDVLAVVEEEITKFRGKVEPSDDATMMAVKVG